MDAHRADTPRASRRPFANAGEPRQLTSRRDAAIDGATRLRGVVFDMDGVLVLSEPLIAEAAIAMFAEKGHVVAPEEFRPFIGAGEDRYIGGVAEARGIRLDAVRDKARMYEIYLERIKERLRPLPGVRAFVATCRRRGLSIAVASGSDRIKVEGNLREVGLAPSLFDAIVDGTQVVRKKPAPDIFIEACRRLRLDPAACLVIEDAVNGVAAAKAAGARCLALTTSFGSGELTQADWIASDLAHVPADVLGW
ncbi:MAG TPA: HAD-IA family hydrolase [Candidatus Limnocylindria bacterium]|nr:HAD-IA family hydrolase [Candidatus Limnocylindria bacterium]